MSVTPVTQPLSMAPLFDPLNRIREICIKCVEVTPPAVMQRLLGSRWMGLTDSERTTLFVDVLVENLAIQTNTFSYVMRERNTVVCDFTISMPLIIALETLYCRKLSGKVTKSGNVVTFEIRTSEFISADHLLEGTTDIRS